MYILIKFDLQIIYLLLHNKMTKPHSKSTLKEMKDYIRKNKLNKAEVKLSMRKSEMVSALKKMGHWDVKNDGAKKTPAPKKTPVLLQKVK